MTHAHLASARIYVPADFAFAHLANGHRLGRWTLGSMDLAPVASSNVWRGRSLFDGSEVEIEIRTHATLGLIDFHLGPEEARVPRVSIRVSAGPDWGLSESSCLVAMTTWRASWMDDERWERTCRTHEVEALLFKAQIETEWNS